MAVAPTLQNNDAATAEGEQKELSPKQLKRLEEQKEREAKKLAKRKEKQMQKERKAAEKELKEAMRLKKLEEQRLEKEVLKTPKQLEEEKRQAEEKALFEKEFLTAEDYNSINHTKKSMLESNRLGGTHMA